MLKDKFLSGRIVLLRFWAWYAQGKVTKSLSKFIRKDIPLIMGTGSAETPSLLKVFLITEFTAVGVAKANSICVEKSQKRRDYSPVCWKGRRGISGVMRKEAWRKELWSSKIMQSYGVGPHPFFGKTPKSNKFAWGFLNLHLIEPDLHVRSGTLQKLCSNWFPL